MHALVQGSEDISRTVDITGMTDLQLSFGAKLRSFENSDRAQVEFRIDGGSWTTLKQFVNGEDDNQYRTYEFAVPGDGDTLDVRFHGQMSSSRGITGMSQRADQRGVQPATPAFPPTISFPHFSGHIKLESDCRSDHDCGQPITLTPAEGGRTGGAWHQEKQFVDVGWETEFQFQLTDGSNGVNGGADGFAFVIQNAGEFVIGNAGGKIGYHKIVNSLAIEFDTAKGGDDPSDSHVSIHTGGTGQNSNFHEASIGYFTTNGFKLDDGNVHHAKITYTPGTLSIYLDDLSTPSLSVPIELGSTLDLDLGRAFVGFTAATGGGWNNHDILDWTFTNTVDTSSTVAISDTEVVEGDSGNAFAQFDVTRMGDLSQALTLDWQRATELLRPDQTTSVAPAKCSSHPAKVHR